VATVLAKRLSETRISAPMRPSGKLEGEVSALISTVRKAPQPSAGK